ncbi:MAG: hypothetical protein KGH71_00240 [Candidatus Micrarchaeota archaeon]|nr:hypothetical protein [Candidatus Micrarchaeota archaeon]
MQRENFSKTAKKEVAKLSNSDIQKLKGMKYTDQLYATVDSPQARCGVLIEPEIAQKHLSEDKIIGASLAKTFDKLVTKEGRKAVYHFGVAVTERFATKAESAKGYPNLVGILDSEWRDFHLIGKYANNPRVEIMVTYGFGKHHLATDPRHSLIFHRSISIKMNGQNAQFEAVDAKEIEKSIPESVQRRIELLIEYNRAFRSKFKNRRFDFDARVFPSRKNLSTVDLINPASAELAYKTAKDLDAEITLAFRS